MSQLIGAYGSIDPQSNRNFATMAPWKTPNIVPYGNFLGQGVASVNIDDLSRFRPTAYVLPRQIELMTGFFNMQSNPSTNSEYTTYTTSETTLQPQAYNFF